MAENLVGFLVEKLALLAIDEVSQLRNVKTEILQIKDEFMSMQALVRDADGIWEANHTLKAYVKQIRVVAFETEDLLDDAMHLYQRGSKNLFKWRKVAKTIKDIQKKVQRISSRREEYSSIIFNQGSTSTSTEATPRDPRKDALLIEEADIVGNHESRDRLINWLVNDTQNSSLGIASVYGEGGLGKTTLVKKVYDNQTVRGHFPYRAWVTVSETFIIKRLLEDLIKQLMNEEQFKKEKDELEKMEDHTLKLKVQSALQGQRYVIILDDIWKLDAWKDFKTAFPNDLGPGSRIVVTTRSQDIASRCIFENYNLTFRLPYLKDDDTWKLFCKKSMALDDVNRFPPRYKEIAQNLLRKCNGLPLAIVCIGGLLQRKVHLWEWQGIYENLGHLMEINDQFNDLNLILSLSFMDLPFHLKSCLLTLGLFPEDSSINCASLIRMWVAEAFVQRNPSGGGNSMTKEDIARDYLNELISRSLLQAERLDATGTVKICRVHDLMREFILFKGREQDFVEHIVGHGDAREAQRVGRRILVDISHESYQKLLISKKKRFVSQLRSLILTNLSLMSTPFIDGPTLSRSKHLRVLDIGALVNKFPNEIVNLFNLKYLRLRMANFKYLPKSLGKLQNLEYLIMEQSLVCMMPKEIVKLELLRYISFHGFLRFGIEFPSGLDELTKLEQLSGVEGSFDMVKRLEKLTNMRNLSIKNLGMKNGGQLLASVEKMKYLRSLSVESQVEPLYVPNLETPPLNLQKLKIKGVLRTCPPWFPKLENLIKLTLKFTKIKVLLKGLQTLPNLVELKLHIESFIGEKLYFEKGGFPRLKVLHLHRLRKLQMVVVKKGAMPWIRNLSIEVCSMLEAQRGMEHLITLESISFNDVQRKFVDEIISLHWDAEQAPIITVETNPMDIRKMMDFGGRRRFT